ncbi:Uncharacterised protein [Salmonella enterica subsp. enterica serovar Typhi]|nr:Uncharacterised protein [Salmonella enterica subsp. enterica serovar Typhi]CHE33897.1 Uncharacterised protein [Salmonella enterica subsp. enterica serovar Typhi]CHH77567.1 Uncharacterised protein [Salmonella enterica subsp. enterica serovar Typhi]CHI74913.1 Uncharacterised protein [Salmonella enterica subsp. enterica serovar Typhi]CHK89493.1 Uncharacterised protein [Salmonella enterica subsp. enterica serovar Typhi]
MRHQLLCESVLRVGKHIKHLARFHNLTARHHRHAIANRFDHVHFMGDQHNSNPELRVDLSEQGQNRGGSFQIQSGSRFVTQQNIRMVSDGAGYPHPLFLPAAELYRKTVRFIGKAHQR